MSRSRTKGQGIIMAKRIKKAPTVIREGDIKGRIPEQLWAMNQVSLCRAPSVRDLKKRERKNAKHALRHASNW